MANLERGNYKGKCPLLSGKASAVIWEGILKMGELLLQEKASVK